MFAGVVEFCLGDIVVATTDIAYLSLGRAIPDDPRYNLLPSGTLRLLRSEPSDAGIYRCEAANSVGAQHAQVTLTVIPRTPLVFARYTVIDYRNCTLKKIKAASEKQFLLVWPALQLLCAAS